MTIKNLSRNRWLHYTLGVAFLAALTGCPASPAPTAAAPSAQPPVVQQPVVVEQPTVVVGDGLIYYPSYEVYFDPGARVYWYSRGGRWVSGPAPEGVSVDVLGRAPSVRMDFHDSPENHHTEVARRYPHDWSPSDRDRH